MKNTKKFILAILVGVLTFSLMGCSKNTKTNDFKPKLDTDANVVLDIKGFFGNFEALDQVMADFNKYYPNVSYSYEQVGGSSTLEYLKSDSNIDIFMTSDEVTNGALDVLDDYYVDFTDTDIDVSCIDSKLLDAGKIDGKLVAIPIGQITYGMIVNETLLENEGLSIPDTYEKFLDTLGILKDKGYTPIQGPSSKVYAEMSINMVIDMIESDEELYSNLREGNSAAVDSLMPVVEKIGTIISNKYTDEEINSTYPVDNYDEAILRFFEGDVPFWICDTEKVSGMKKRETKSEAFSANPFKYSYVYVPMGEDGVYAYHEPWYGFSVCKKADNYDYAMEFMRFMTNNDELNTLADVKGVPSIAEEKSDNPMYASINNPVKSELVCYRDEKIKYQMIEGWYSCINKYVSGEYSDEKQMLEAYVNICSEAMK